jgi:hypothetical protein
MHTSTRLPVLALVGSSIIWGCTWIPLKYFASAGLDGAALFFIAYGSVLVFALPLLLRQVVPMAYTMACHRWYFLSGWVCQHRIQYERDVWRCSKDDVAVLLAACVGCRGWPVVSG